jgi:hypothetical protein
MDPMDKMIMDRATRRLIITGATPIILGFLSFCCNPLLVVSFLAVASSVLAFTTPNTMKPGLDELYPEGAGKACIIMGAIGLAIAVGRLCLDALFTFVLIT